MKFKPLGVLPVEYPVRAIQPQARQQPLDRHTQIGRWAELTAWLKLSHLPAAHSPRNAEASRSPAAGCGFDALARGRRSAHAARAAGHFAQAARRARVACVAIVGGVDAR